MKKKICETPPPPLLHVRLGGIHNDSSPPKLINGRPILRINLCTNTCVMVTDILKWVFNWMVECLNLSQISYCISSFVKTIFCEC